jgi:hypothetical protein
VDIYGEEGENSYTDSLNTKAGEMLVEDLLEVNTMKAKCYNDWFKYAEKCNLPKLMTLLKTSNSTVVKCEQCIEKLLKTRPLTYSQMQLLKQKE